MTPIDPAGIRIVLGKTSSGHVYVGQQPSATEVAAELEGADAQRGAGPSGERQSGDSPISARDRAGQPGRRQAWDAILASGAAPDSARARADDRPCVEFHSTPDAYHEAVSSALASGAVGRIPVLSSRFAMTDGLPSEQVSLAAPPAASAAGVCLAFAEPTCVAGARLLAAFSGRLLEIVEPAAWQGRVAEVLARRERRSIALVMPSWRSDGQLDLHALAETIDTLCGACSSDFCAEVGIITGADSGALTIAVAKSLLHRSIAARFSQTPAVIVHASDDPDTPLAEWTPSSGAGLWSFSPQDGDHEALVKSSFAAVMFSGHGKGYCACKGCLCSARPPELSAGARPPCCVFGLDCVDPGYPQTDVRRYDTPLMVMDVCSAGNPDLGLSEAGVPPLALLAAAATPAAVITCDRMQLGQCSDLQLVAPLAGAATAGAAVARLNRLRRQTNFDGDFYLLGDPDLPSDVWRGHEWARSAVAMRSDAEAGWRVHLEPGATPYVQIAPDACARSAGTWFAWHGDGRSSPPAGIAYHDGEATELWFPVARADGRQAEYHLACRETPALPAGLVRTAEIMPVSASWWRGPMTSELPRMLNAAGEIVKFAREADEYPASLLCVRPDRLAKRVDDIVRAWTVAQRSCLEALSDDRSGSLWPWEFTGTHRSMSVRRAGDCPQCGRSPLAHHHYRVSGREERVWCECGYCDVISDLPSATRIAVGVDGPAGVTPPAALVATVTVSNASPEVHVLGAGTVLVPKDGPFRADPATFAVALAPGEQCEIECRLDFEGGQWLARRYGLRAVLLLNDELHWIGRQLVVTDRSRPDALEWL
jgi:hypothetical protein